MMDPIEQNYQRDIPMIQKIAVSVFGNRVSSRFDCSENVLLVTLENGAVIQRQEIRWVHVNSLEKVHLLAQEGVSLLICGGLTETYASLLHDVGIHVVSWVRGEVEDVLLQLREGRLHSRTPTPDDTISL
jgi:predicted Fe-Mo cluster-binding NifX family protein